MDRPLKIFFWPASVNDGCWHYRIKLPAEALAARGHDVWSGQTMSERAKEDADIIVGQRVALGPPAAMWLMLSDSPRRKPGAAKPLKLVYEVDDDLFSIDPKHNTLAAAFKAPGVRQNMRDSIALSDLVTVSTPHLAKVAARFNPRTAVLPNSVDPAVLDVPAPGYRGTDHAPLIFGWQGSPTHHTDWRVALPAVAEVMERHEQVWMRFLGTFYPDGLPAARVGFAMWTTDLDRYYRRIARFDVGLAPLADIPFNRSKSELRFVEAAALGLPMVCSDLLPYRQVVEHGVTGFLAKDPADWVAPLEALVTDHSLRRKVGEAARERAREWTIDRRITAWEEAYRGLL